MKSMLRKFFALFCCLALCLALTGCERADYVAAVEVYNSGDFQTARELFLALGEYEDSAALAKRCDYHLAVQIYESGDFQKAIEALEKLGDYEDCQALITHSRYQIALALKEAKDYDAAEAAFEALSGYENSDAHLSLIRWLRFTDALLAADGLTGTNVRVSTTAEDPYAVTVYAQQTLEEGYLLFDDLTLTVRYQQPQAQYAATSKFILTLHGKEYGSTQTCSGSLTLAELTSETVPAVENYRIEVLDIQGESSSHTDPADHSMTQGLAANYAAILAELPGLLESLDSRFTVTLLGLPQFA